MEVHKRMLVQLYFVLAINFIYFCVLLVMSHITHALTLLISSYQVLCSVIALVGYVATIQNICQDLPQSTEQDVEKEGKKPASGGNDELKNLSEKVTHHLRERRRSMMNTFGWARIDVLFLLVGTVFLGSLCFSVLVEALQTLVHISHHDEMHHPIHVLCLGALGMVVSIFCFSLVGGYMYQEGTLLRLTDKGEVVLETIAEKEEAKKQNKILPLRRNCWFGMARDNIGNVFVIASGFAVFFTEEPVAKYMDPLLSMASTFFLLLFNFPFMKESCYILLQTIPNHIDIVTLKAKLLSSFPKITNVHDFHIWQLTEEKIILTAHLSFLRSQDFQAVNEDIIKFFNEIGITHVTIQPEFFDDPNYARSTSICGFEQCLVKCNGNDCLQALCCSVEAPLEEVKVKQIKNGNDIKNKEDMDDSINTESTEALSNKLENSELEGEKSERMNETEECVK